MALTPKHSSKALDDYIDNVELADAPKPEPSLAYRFDFETGRISGVVDEMEALKQFIRKALITRRSRYLIYDDDYGCEIPGLLGEDVTDGYLQSEIPRMVREALVYDDRIEDVTNIVVTRKNDSVFIQFTVISIFGDIDEGVVL
ncbi:DUF2634 domain-containing protein [Bacillus chungangensis]|uniref:Phage baseplate assembly protein W n=1 Tax=Bacillus chungangensis TaxID=587633 RepID=A0ABT9WM95_9BACI|nr:DUF2634 domain-containing protein [Bacillus chungangensis]MDQ0174371.1 phage baseplate assembly protein W [Bacillus chungangensis]